jgi:hypothetical protein
MLVLSAVASAQTERLETDPRNISPAVGTGGNPGGPTGLFTIYDGQTLRRGEFTFSIAYSNYDRDPGNVDITEVPVSFQIGLNDHLELFFNTDAYRGIKINNVANLSSFYLPNSQPFGPGRGTAPAIVLAPVGPNVGTIALAGAVFRPLGSQPFVQFPYVGGSAGNFGTGPGGLGTLFGFPGFNATLGPANPAGGGNFSGAGTFPGLGSPVGSILPGIVLATATLPCTALTGNCRPPGSPNPLNPIIVPTVYTITPAYLPDAPFDNRQYGQTAFNTFTVGAKIALTAPNAPLSVAISPFYRWYADKANDVAGFNQLQRGASPGGNIGDFGVIGVISGRLSRSVNISANLGYVLNSNPKGKFPTGDVVLLDRPNEFLAGLGFDFPINKHFQPIAEIRSTEYVGSRTPNAFGNNPVEALAGLKIYPSRWFGIGVWYRYHINQQDLSSFNGVASTINIQNLSGVNVPGRGVVVVPGTSAPQTAGNFPIGFVPSDDANGFGFQIWAGHRNARIPAVLPNQPPVVSLAASSSTVTAPCPPGMTGSCTNASQSVTLTANATDPDGDTLLYTYSTTGGRISGEGANATWDLTGVQPGTYTSTVEVDDGCGCVSFSTTSVTVANCSDCHSPCPTITVDCPTSGVRLGQPATVTVNLANLAPGQSPTYNWSVSDGTISSGQGTTSITIDTTGQDGKNITATVEVGGLPPECQHTASCSFSVQKELPHECKNFDEYGNIKFNDEKARLDNYAIALQQDTSSTATILVYAGRTDPAGTAQARADRAKNYLVTTRGIDASRITILDGGCRESLIVDLYTCPAGATPVVAVDTVPCEPGAAKKPRGKKHK